MKKVLPAVLFLGLFCCQVFSQQRDTLLLLKEVEVTAAALLREKGIVRTHIDSLVIRQSLHSSLASLLGSHSPVFIKSYGGGGLATASFRGTAASHTKVEWNGVPINNPMLGQVDFSGIPVFFVDNMNLYHGGNSMHEGSGALGGSIHLLSRPDWSKKLYGSVGAGFGSFQTLQQFVGIGGGGKKLQLRFRYMGERSANDFEFLNTANGLWNIQKQQNASHKRMGALSELFWQAGKGHLLSVNVWFQKGFRDLPPLMWSRGEERQEWQDDEDTRIAARWEVFKSKARWSFSSGIAHSRMAYFLSHNSPLGLWVNYDSRSETLSFFQKARFSYEISERFHLRSFLDFNVHDASFRDMKNGTGYEAQRNEFGSGVSLHYALADRGWVYTLIRQEWSDWEFLPIMPSVGLEFLPVKSSALVFKANASRNYHRPTLNDLYWIPGGNPALKPEKGYSSEAGLEYSIKVDSLVNFKVSAMAYASLIEDWIVWRPGKFAYWSAENLKEVFARGLEVSLSGLFRINKVETALNINYAFTRTTNQKTWLPNDASQGKQLIYIPMHKANSLFSTTYKSWSGTWAYNYTGLRYTTSSNEGDAYLLPGFGLHQASLGKRWKLIGNVYLDCKLQVHNVLNTSYQEILWRPMPGRHYLFLVKIGF